MKTWTPDSYLEYPAQQQPQYDSTDAYEENLRKLASYPPIVFPGEVDSLKEVIAAAGKGNGFILQGGDCVERFGDCRQETITNKLKILLQMSVILTYAARRPVVRIGRIAGQYFKPRSKPFDETPGGRIPAYRGDGINGVEADPVSRRHDPARLEAAYFHAASTLNYIRAMISGGFADLHNPYNWNLYDIERTARWDEYRGILDHITDAVSFMESFGGARGDQLGNISFYTSHEALHLGYESALSRKSPLHPQTGGYYNLGAHMIWIGERTRDIGGAHVEYARGVENPVGIKIGPDIDPGELGELVRILSPRKEPGKIVIITRLGTGRVTEVLPELIRAVRATGVPVVWSCDPMHGNTRITSGGIKTRGFEDVLRELSLTFSTHRTEQSGLSGVHFELTGEDVTECTGGAVEIADEDLARNYRSYCDPRLNYAQSMEMSFLISDYVRTS